MKTESHGHARGHGHDLRSVSTRIGPVAARIVTGILLVCGIGIIVGLVVLWPTHQTRAVPLQFQSVGGGSQQTVTGTVVAQTFSSCGNQQGGTVFAGDASVLSDPQGTCIQSTVSLTSGPDRGSNTLIQVATNRDRSQASAAGQRLTPEQAAKPQAGQPTLHVGDKVRLSRVTIDQQGTRYSFFDFQRTTPLVFWAVVFVLAVVAVAAWRGLRSIIGLVVAFGVLLVFTLPAILDGRSPVTVAIVSSAAILFVVIYLAHGVSLRTSAALIGTLTSLAATALLSWLAVTTTNITGLSNDQTNNLQVYQTTISANGILLAGFIIGALGVLNDVTITQASTVFELVGTGQPSRRATFTAAMRVGRDHIASTVYTLVFAYAGSALPLLLLFSVAGQSFTDLATTDTVTVELARSFVGSIGIALSVPLTTAVAVALAQPRASSRSAGDASASPTAGRPQSPPRAARSEGARVTRPPGPPAGPRHQGGRHSLPE
ncbi:YibE/F family protein [Williamsia sterculiae]|uniref:YibE/F family protein n=1 Tax=Williamsia sterculiae TaxID=1344003 RepID=UPI001F392898|nr:YibE/F family protein [Williamsia sterculiae]